MKKEEFEKIIYFLIEKNCPYDVGVRFEKGKAKIDYFQAGGLVRLETICTNETLCRVCKFYAIIKTFDEFREIFDNADKITEIYIDETKEVDDIQAKTKNKLEKIIKLKMFGNE